MFIPGQQWIKVWTASWNNLILHNSNCLMIDYRTNSQMWKTHHASMRMLQLYDDISLQSYFDKSTRIRVCSLGSGATSLPVCFSHEPELLSLFTRAMLKQPHPSVSVALTAVDLGLSPSPSTPPPPPPSPCAAPPLHLCLPITPGCQRYKDFM